MVDRKIELGDTENERLGKDYLHDASQTLNTAIDSVPIVSVSKRVTSTSSPLRITNYNLSGLFQIPVTRMEFK